MADILAQLKCTACLAVKLASEFNVDNGRPNRGNRHSYCRDCQRAKWETWYQENLSDARNRDRLRKRLAKYGMTETDYDVMLELQGGCCAICRGPELYKDFAIDHDHRCCPRKKSCGKCVRGLLCQACNRAIGLLRESPEVLRAAADYIERHQAVSR